MDIRTFLGPRGRRMSESSTNDPVSGNWRPGDYYEDDKDLGPFDIVRTKSASADPRKRWRQVALVRNASRRFLYTLDLEKEEKKKKIIAKIRAHAQAIKAAILFKNADAHAGAQANGHKTRVGRFSKLHVKMGKFAGQ